MYGVQRQSHFVRHGPCSKCGSKDNVGWYSNGSGFCFGCGAFYPATNSSRVDLSTRPTTTQTGEVSLSRTQLRSPPDDCCFEFPASVMEWVGKYGLDAATLMKHNICWSPHREQLIYKFYGEGDDLVLWQARNFKDTTTHKTRFFTGGAPEEVIAAYYPEQKTDTGVLVEDCISALKVALSGSGDGIPCFSASVSTSKIARLSRLYKKLIVWLDNDKFGESVKISNRIKLLGVESFVVSTSFDPKLYNLAQIRASLQ